MDKVTEARWELAQIRACATLNIYGECRDSERPKDANCQHGSWSRLCETGYGRMRRMPRTVNMAHGAEHAKPGMAACGEHRVTVKMAPGKTEGI